MARPSVVLDAAAIRSLLDSPAGPVAADLKRRGERVLARAQELCPVDKGPLRNSLTMEMRVSAGRLVARVGTNVEYALPVHEGSRAHTVRPKVKPYLAFKNWPNAPAGARRSKRGFYVYRSVRIPARAGNPFLRNALPAAAG